MSVSLHHPPLVAQHLAGKPVTRLDQIGTLMSPEECDWFGWGAALGGFPLDATERVALEKRRQALMPKGAK